MNRHKVLRPGRLSITEPIILYLTIIEKSDHFIKDYTVLHNFNIIVQYLSVFQ